MNIELRSRPKVRRALPLVAGVAAVLFTVSACGSDDSAGEPTDKGAETPSTTETTPEPSESATPEPPEGMAEKAWTRQAAKALRSGIPALVPSDTSSGYALTGATFTAEPAPAWHIELTDGAGTVATVDQSLDKAGDLVAERLGTDASPGEPVDLADFGTGTWETYEGVDSVSMSLQLKDGSALVTAPSLDEATAIAKTMLTYEIDPGAAED